MGFSPGSFKDQLHEMPIHWEGKSGGRIVLWTHNELDQLLFLDLTNAREALDQLRLLVELAEADGL